ncbi:AMP-binding protein [Agrobacterium vitis]|uniref:AMP-binding protein n=1 Tax=Agrobacterium vitis TaxID=373 RepID=UPI003D291803
MLCDYYSALTMRLHMDRDTVALVNGKQTLTYHQLGQRVAAIHKALSVQRTPGQVLVRGHKETDVVAAMIASTLAGRGFVFAEANYPAARIQQIIETCGCTIMVNVVANEDVYPIPQIDSFDLGDEVLSPIVLEAEDEEALFYITFTSGSTGQPKGIPISRSNFSTFADWIKPIVDQSAGGSHACINHASMAFDMSMSDIWPALFSGRAIYLLDHCNNTNPYANISLLNRNCALSAGTLMSTPAFLAIMLEAPQFKAERLPHLRAFWLGGEGVPKPLLKRLRQAFPDCQIYHAYGPSEVTCVTHCILLDDTDFHGDDPLPLGIGQEGNLALVDTGDGVLRQSGQGEIVLLGGQVAGHYLPKSHANNVNFSVHEGQRSYRTGNLGVISESGGLTIVGRIDRQIKLNGYRIELGEIEQCALEVAGVFTAVVVPQLASSKSLVLVVSGEALNEASKEVLRMHIEARLPAYMRPSRIEIDQNIHLSLSGKIDRLKMMSLYA